MADEVTIGGKKFPKWGIYASIAGGLGVIGYVWYQHKQNSSASSSSGIDPVTGMPYSQDNQVDPLTGMTYLQEAQAYGSVSAAESAAQAQNYQGADAYGYSGGTVSGVPYSTVSGTETGTNYTSNAAWAQAAEAGLTDIGYTSTDVSGALGRYLAGLSLTSDQATIVYAALAEYGTPPVGSFQVILAPSTTPTTGSGNGTGTGTGTGSGTGTTTTPQAPEPVSWVSAQWVNATSANVHWAPSSGATQYQVRVTYQSQVTQTHMTTGENYTITGLTPDHTYGVHVVAIGASGAPWAPEASTTIHTPQ